MNLLVTGAAGFIGSSFVRQALGKPLKGDTVIGIPNLNKIVVLDLLTYAGRRENLGSVQEDKRLVFCHGDICDASLVRDLMERNQIDAVVNFAAESHVDRSIESSAPFVRSNVVGTVTLLDAALKRNAKFLQVSTDEVYGALGPTGKFTEDTPIAPNSPYSASKAAADCFVRSYFETHKLFTIITRCTNNYGPYQFPEKFLPLAITRLKAGKKIPVYGEGKNVRDWIHVEDHCLGIAVALMKGRAGEVYNFGGFGERSNLEMAGELAQAFGKRPQDVIEFVSDRKGHDFRYAMDPAKVVRDLGWTPKWDLQAGLKQMIEWYRS